MPKLPPYRSYKGGWGINKIPYPTSGAGRDIKPPRRGGCLRKIFKWFMVGAVLALVLAIAFMWMME